MVGGISVCRFDVIGMFNSVCGGVLMFLLWF